MTLYLPVVELVSIYCGADACTAAPGRLSFQRVQEYQADQQKSATTTITTARSELLEAPTRVVGRMSTQNAHQAKAMMATGRRCATRRISITNPKASTA